MEKQKNEYPELTLDYKKATTNEVKAVLFKQFLESIFIAKPEHKISDQGKMLLETNILNGNDLEMVDMNENHKNIQKVLTNIIKKLDIKKACSEDKIMNKMIKLTDNGKKNFLFKLFNHSLYHGYYPKVFKKSQIRMLHKPGKPKSEITYCPLSLTSCLGKILEKIILKRVKDWCSENNIINNKTVLEVKEV